jgi:hypothetical protein
MIRYSRLHCAQAGISGFGGGAGGPGGGGGPPLVFVNALLFPVRSGRLWTERQAGFAGGGGPGGGGGGPASGGGGG